MAFSQVAALAIAVTLTSCTKKHESASIKLVMPHSISTYAAPTGQNLDQQTGLKFASPKSQKTVSTRSNSEIPQWNTSLNPTAGLQINCFAVFVGGPNLSGNSCDLTDAGVARKIDFGPHIGFVPSGATVRVDVPAGPDRVFHIVGLRSATAAACSNFQNTQIDETNLSEPFLIASQRADIPAGESTLNVVASLNLNRKISTCSFVNSGGGGGGDDGGGGGGGTTISFGNSRDGDLTSVSGAHYLFQNFVAVGTPSPGLTHTPKMGGIASTKILGADRRVTAIATAGAEAGRLVTVAVPFTSEVFEVGDEVIWHVSSGKSNPGAPDDPVAGACGGGLYLGRYGFATVEATPTTTQLLLSTSIADDPALIRNSMLTAATNNMPGFCRIAITRVSNFDDIQIASGSTLYIYPKEFDQEQGTGGTLVLRAKRLAIDGTFNLIANGTGYRGGLPAYAGGSVFGFGGYGATLSSGSGGGVSLGAVGGAGGAGAGEGGLESTLSGRPQGGLPLTHGQSDLFTSISSGNLHSCGLTASGKIKCFGDGQSHQLGMGASVLSVFTTPHQIESEEVYSNVVSGFRHSCAIRSSNSQAYCWGQGTSGQIGNNALINTGVPLMTSGSNTFSMLSSSHGSFTCGIALITGTGYCWGLGTSGQLGNGLATTSAVPVAVSGGHSFKKISAGEFHACGISSTNQIYCWGDNVFGRIGDATTVQRNAPVLVDGGTTYKDVAAGGSHTCGITSTDDLKCWGAGSFGQLGTGSSPTEQVSPVSVAAGGSKYKSITAGLTHTCAITTTDDLQCWGKNSSGQLGDLSFANRNLPTPISATVKFKQVSAGGNHTCGVSLNNEASYCWGNSELGQLGNGSFNNQWEPVKVRDQLYPFPITEQKMFKGGGGGAGSTDQNGGNGGGVVLVFAKEISGTGSMTVSATGGVGSGFDFGSGGGGGGTIGLATRAMSLPSVSLFAKGGAGATGFSSGGGGGGAIEVRRCASQSTISPAMSAIGGFGTGTSLGGAYGVLKLENLEPLCSLD